MMRAVTALAGVVLVAVPVAADPRAAYPVAVIGLVCALVIGWPRRGAAAGRRVAAAIRTRAWIPARAETGRRRARPASRPAPARQAGRARQSRARQPCRQPRVGTGAAAEGREPNPAAPMRPRRCGRRPGRWSRSPSSSRCAASRLDTAAMAGEGLLLLGFLLLLGRPAGLAGGTTRAWLRLRLPAVLGARGRDRDRAGRPGRGARLLALARAGRAGRRGGRLPGRRAPGPFRRVAVPASRPRRAARSAPRPAPAPAARSPSPGPPGSSRRRAGPAGRDRTTRSG